MKQSRKDKIEQKQLRRKQLEAELSQVEHSLRQLRTNADLKITDHAFVRFAERTGIIDTNDLSGKIVTEQVKKYFSELGDGTYPTGDKNTRVVIKNATIVTVLT